MAITNTLYTDVRLLRHGINYSSYLASSDAVAGFSELGQIGEEIAVTTNSMILSRHSFTGTEESHKNHSQHTRYSGRYSDRAP
jgi:hypothetical protein